MDNTSNNTSSPKSPILCTAGCGFFGSEAFNNMCSQCYKSANKPTTPATTTTTTTTTTTKVTSSPVKPPIVAKSPPTLLDDTTIIPTIERSRKHLRSPSPDDPRTLACNSAPTSAIASPAPLLPTTSTNEASSTASSPLPPTSDDNSKPVQTNKGRCFKCRLKVPLAKQAANKCRCGYVFCDSHRYPDRHDCDIDFAKLDREILAKNNPKLHERPRGGRSFQRIDSL